MTRLKALLIALGSVTAFWASIMALAQLGDVGAAILIFCFAFCLPTWVIYLILKDVLSIRRSSAAAGAGGRADPGAGDGQGPDMRMLREQIAELLKSGEIIEFDYGDGQLRYGLPKHGN